MQYDSHLKVFDLEKEGKSREGFELLEELAEGNHPLALIELGTRYLSGVKYDLTEFGLEKDDAKARNLIEKGKNVLKKLADNGDGEAMRMLGYLYLGLLTDYEKSEEKGESYLLKSYESGCYVAANDLHSLYLHKDKEKSKHYYDEATRHGCRVVYYEEFET